MNREVLEQYRASVEKVAALTDQIERLQDAGARYEYGTVKGSNPEFPYQPITFHLAGYNIAADEEHRERIEKLKIRLEEQKSESERLLLDVMEFVAGIQNPEAHTIFARYYLDGWTQERIADALHIDRSRVSRKIDQYLKNAQKTRKAQHAQKKI